MNIVEIARRARVSSATVSRTLNGSPLVRDKTAERVRKVIQELGYIPNSGARSLSSGRSRLLGVIISDIKNPFFPDLISSFEQLSMEHGYQVIFANTNYEPARLEHCIRSMMERRVDGIALMISEMHEPAVALLKRQHIPVVTLQHRISGSSFHTMRVDHTPGIKEAVQHLIGLGHSDFAFIAGPPSQLSANKRRELFLAELDRNQMKLSPGCLLEGNHRVEGGFAAMKKILLLKHRPTAILTSNDLTALGALKAINEAGLEVPRDFSLVGFDDLELASLVHPPLTTIRIPRSEIAMKAFLALLANGNDTPMKTRESLILTSLVIRESTAPPASRAVN